MVFEVNRYIPAFTKFIIQEEVDRTGGECVLTSPLVLWARKALLSVGSNEGYWGEC